MLIYQGIIVPDILQILKIQYFPDERGWAENYFMMDTVDLNIIILLSH